jgi:serine/alanine adding enzyme
VSRLVGSEMCIRDSFNYGGVLADSEDITSLLWRSAAKLGEELGVSHIEARHVVSDLQVSMVRTDKVSMVLSLPLTSEELFNQLQSKLRSQIRRPQREGAYTQIGGAELLSEFYAVFSENMRDLGTPVYSLDFFKTILEEFPQASRLLVVRVAKKPVAAAFLIGDHGRMEIPWASSLREYNHLSVNMQLYWDALKYSIENRYRSFDFGRCTIDSGTYNFKKQWGAKPVQLYWFYWVKDGGSMPCINPSNPKYRLFIMIWKRLPLWFSNWLGPKLVKHLP